MPGDLYRRSREKMCRDFWPCGMAAARHKAAIVEGVAGKWEESPETQAGRRFALPTGMGNAWEVGGKF
jgi:hypothetical protein